MNFKKVSILLLLLYASSLTVMTLLAFTVGPFRESVPLWARLRSLESEFQESQRKQKSLEEERGRLLTAVKSLQADWSSQRETIRVLREAVKDPDIERRLLEANRMVEKLNQERAVLIVKLDEIQKKFKLLAEEKITVKP
ncbi:MAG: hypothetical protein HY542_06920 [Deltaproteobacteria bacterium]|nr:hypothetical protein [Deltaproteobacteria bacterium]